MEKEFAFIYHDLASIPMGHYEGYFWISESKNPEKVSTPDDISKLKSFNGNPFVMEALLYDRAAKRSIHLQHTGRYIITQYEWEQFDEGKMVSEQTDQVVFLPQRIEGVKGLNFSRVWKKEPDPLCENKEVLKMNAIVFCGFKH